MKQRPKATRPAPEPPATVIVHIRIPREDHARATEIARTAPGGSTLGGVCALSLRLGLPLAAEKIGVGDAKVGPA